MKKVSNPLTIVSIFAGLAETAGTVVLPFIKSDLQFIFILYLIIFPILIVILFFLTWNFNPKVLYSPNDFSDENNYMESLKIFYDIKQTVEQGKQNGEKEKEIIDKIYNNVSNEIFKLGNLENEIIKLLSKNSDGMTRKEIAQNLSISQNMATRKIMTLQDMQIIEIVPKIIETSNGTKRTLYVFKLSEHLNNHKA